MTGQQNAHGISFERHPWTIVEIEAVNIFIKRLPQYHIHSYLKRAFDSITASYGGVSTADIVDPTSSPSLIALEASAETTPSDTQAVTILTDIPRDLQTRQNHHPEPERENSREPSPTGPQDRPRACNQESNSTYPQDEGTEGQAVAGPQALQDSLRRDGGARGRIVCG